MPYGDEIKQGNITENWLFDFANDNSGYIRLAFSDTIDSSNFYHGVILNKPSIRESIDLASSTAKSSNLSVSIPDFTYQGSPISEELFGGSNHYINQTVSVYSKVGGGSKVQIGSFRLTDISSNGDTIQLSLTSHRPWDFISFPQDKSTVGKIDVPIAYGDFIKNTNSTYSSPQYIDPTNYKYRPIPFNNNRDGNDYYISHKKAGSQHSNSESAIYDKSLKSFLPLEGMINDSQNNTVTEDGVNCVYAVRPNIRGFKQTGISTETIDNALYTGNNIDWATPDNAIDKNDSSVATFNTSSHGSAYVHNTGDGDILRLHIERPDGEFSQGSVEIKYNLNVTLPILYHTSDYITLRVKIIDNNGGSDSTDYTYSASSGNYVPISPARLNNTNKTETITYTSSDSFPEYFDFYVDVVANNQNNAGTDYWVLWNLEAKEFTFTIEMQSDDEKPSELLFTGADGVHHNITGLTGLASEIHEAHLDLLNRFTGLDVATSPTADIDGWSSLNTSKTQTGKEWKIRWWQLEPIELKKALEQLQYEGGFIFRFKADGSPQYIHIKDSYSSAEITTLTKQDVSNVSVNPSPFSDILTKMDVNYERHPAEKRYLTSVSSSNSTSRTNWNIQAKENIKKVDLDAYVSPTIPTTPSTNPNDDFYTYYDNIFGDIKMIVSCTIVNPAFYNLEVGDIIDFSDMYPEKPFGYNSGSWSGLKFMITSLQRTLGEMKIEAREI